MYRMGGLVSGAFCVSDPVPWQIDLPRACRQQDLFGLPPMSTFPPESIGGAVYEEEPNRFHYGGPNDVTYDDATDQAYADSETAYGIMD